VANKKVDPAVKQVGVCGCVTQKTKKLLIDEAIRRQITVASVIGGLLEDWAEGRVLAFDIHKIDEYLPYRHHQEEKGRKEGKEYQEGPLGKILRKTHSKRVD
jgi:hypothetical protein